MLNVIFGREHAGDNFVLDARIFFKYNKKPEWFSDPFIKRVLRGIDKCEVLFEEALKDRTGHGISTMMISTGSKTLCCLYFNPDKVFYGSSMGDNCIPFYMELARSRDISLCFEHYPDISEEYFNEGLLIKDGVVLDEDSFDEAFCDWMAETREIAESWERENEKL